VTRLSRSRPSFGALIACLLAAVFLVSRPAHASIAADFNCDGILDSIQLSRSTDTRVVVHVSGFDPQVLKTRGHLVTIIAIDVDRDGHLDLGALSEHRGIIIWLNKGGSGHFSVLKKHRRNRHGHTLSSGHRELVPQREQDSPPAPAGQDGPQRTAYLDDSSASFILTLHAYTLHIRGFATASGLNASTGSRAPPLAV